MVVFAPDSILGVNSCDLRSVGWRFGFHWCVLLFSTSLSADARVFAFCIAYVVIFEEKFHTTVALLDVLTFRKDDDSCVFPLNDEFGIESRWAAAHLPTPDLRILRRMCEATSSLNPCNRIDMLRTASRKIMTPRAFQPPPRNQNSGCHCPRPLQRARPSQKRISS